MRTLTDRDPNKKVKLLKKKQKKNTILFMTSLNEGAGTVKAPLF